MPIGYVHVSSDGSHDLGYGLRKEFWHKGICMEACRAVIGRLKQSEIPYITATHDVNNPRSGKVMQAIGNETALQFFPQWAICMGMPVSVSIYFVGPVFPKRSIRHNHAQTRGNMTEKRGIARHKLTFIYIFIFIIPYLKKFYILL